MNTIQLIGFYAILSLAIISTGILLYFGKVDPAIFASLITFVLGVHVQSPLNPSVNAIAQNTQATQQNTAAIVQDASKG